MSLERFERAVLALIRQRYLAIFVAGLVLAGLALAVAGFRVENSIESWVDQGDEKYRNYRALVQEFGDDASIQVVFERSALTAGQLPGYLALLDRIRELPAVTQVFDPVDRFLLDLQGENLATDLSELRAGRARGGSDPLDVLISRDLATVGTLILLDQQQSDAHPQVLQAVREGFADLDLPVQLAGTAYVAQTIADALTRDITLVVSGLMTISILVLLFQLRNVFVVASVFLGIVMSVIFCLAFATLTAVKLNLLSLVLFPLVFCVGLTTAIHLFARTADGRWQLEHAWLHVVRPATLATVTTVIGSVAFGAAPQRVLRDMGPVILFGIVVTYVVMMLFVPAAYRVLARKWTYAAPPPPRLPQLPVRLRGPVGIALLALGAVSLLLLPRLDTEPDAIFFFADDSELVQNYRSIEQRLTGLLVVEMVVSASDGEPVTAARHRGQLRGFLTRAEGLPGLSGVVSALPWLESPFQTELVPPEVMSAYVSADARRMRLSFRFRNISGVPYAESAAALRRLWADSGTTGLEMQLTGLVPLILEAQDALLKTQALIFPLILLVMTVIFVFAARSPRLLLVACVANFLPLLLMLGLMAVCAIPINSINLFVASVMIGVIVDDSMHLLYACRTEGSIERALAEVRQGLWITSVTMVLAFGSMLLSSMAPIAQFGLLSVFTLAVAYACEVYLLPWLMAPRGVRA